MITTHFAWVISGIASLSMASASLIGVSGVSSERWYRDAVGLTPFSDVVITRKELRDGDLWIWGTLKKVRCEKVGHVAYAYPEGGPLIPARFHSEEPETMPINRPPADLPQAFGPWVISPSTETPDRAAFYVAHECPEGPQVNVVFDVPWSDMTATTQSE